MNDEAHQGSHSRGSVCKYPERVPEQGPQQELWLGAQEPRGQGTKGTNTSPNHLSSPILHLLALPSPIGQPQPGTGLMQPTKVNFLRQQKGQTVDLERQMVLQSTIMLCFKSFLLMPKIFYLTLPSPPPETVQTGQSMRKARLGIPLKLKKCTHG